MSPSDPISTGPVMPTEQPVQPTNSTLSPMAAAMPSDTAVGPVPVQPAPFSPSTPSDASVTDVSPISAPLATPPVSGAPESAPTTAPQLTASDAFAPSGQQPAASSGVVVSVHDNSVSHTAAFTPVGAKPARKGLKLAFIAAAAIVVLGGGSAAAYFGYYMNPSVVWSQSLGNMNKGYGKLVSYLNTQSSTHYKGFAENGSFQVNSNGTNFDGSLDSQSDGGNSTLSAKLDLGAGNLDLEERSLKAASATEPDVYVKFSGISTVNDLLGYDMGPQIDSLDGKWIVIDHNLIADIKSQIAKDQQAQGSSQQLTWADVNSFLQAAGKVDQQYVFTTNNSTSVTKVVKTYGKESVDGHSTMHYKVGFVPAHVKAYVTAMCSALQQSQLGVYIKNETGEAVGTSSTCKDMESSASSIKSSDTIDVWADTKTRMIYKVRISDTTNPAQNFVDLGLDYKGGNSYPFFMSGQDKTGGTSSTFSVTTTLNTTDKSITALVKVDSKGDSPMTLSGNFTVKPSNAALNIQAPSGAVSITDVLNSLGLSDYLSQYAPSASSQLGMVKLAKPNKPADQLASQSSINANLATLLQQLDLTK